MINITPQTDSNTQVTVGDKITIRWLLDVDADTSNMTFTFGSKTFTGGDITKTQVTINDQTKWRYEATAVLQSAYTQIEFDLSDPVNDATDTAYINANKRLR